MKSIIPHTLSTLRIIAISSLTIFTLYSVQAVWNPPTSSAPNGNVGGPLTTATSTQIKTGSLGLMGNFSVAGKIFANGGLQLPLNAGEGKVLVSDEGGNASWVATSTLGASSSLNSYSMLPQGGVAGWCFEDTGRVYTQSILPAKKVTVYTKKEFCYIPDAPCSNCEMWTQTYSFRNTSNVESYTPFNTTVTSNGLPYPSTCTYNYITENVCGCESGFTSKLTGTLHPGVGTMVDFYYTCVKN